MIYAILGPTCSGKSDFAEKLSLKYNAPIINFDAFQVYKELNKGTAKPSKKELDSGRYFLYDFVSIKEDYNVSRYQEEARLLLEKFKDKDVVMVGGTGLYLKAALFDYKFLKEEKMDEGFLQDVSNEELYRELLLIDKDDAIKIGVNNRKRLLRALYIYKIHNKSKSELNDNGKNTLLYKDVKFYGIDIDRALLYQRIDQRVDKMFEDGLEEEARSLFNSYDHSLRALQAIGYKEFLLSSDKEEIKKMIKNNTHHYAKRQMTFFKHQFNNIEWIKFENV